MPPAVSPVRFAFFSVAALALLSACGGGGGGSAITAPIIPATPGLLTLSAAAPIACAQVAQTTVITVSEANYSGAFYAASSDTTVATVTLQVGSSNTFVVICVGGGSATLAFSDNTNQRVTVSVASTVQAPTFTSHSAAAGAFGITAINGNLWVAGALSGQIDDLSSTGAITAQYTQGYYSPPNYSGPTVHDYVEDLAGGNDGGIWFIASPTEGASYPGFIGRLDPTRSSLNVTQYSLLSGGRLSSIASGPDGALWFTEEDANNIGRISTSGQVTEYRIPTSGALPLRIVAGPDAALWFTEVRKIGRITTTGQITEYALPSVNVSGDSAWDIVAGPDGALWFTQLYTGIGRITTAGQITMYSVPNITNSTVTGITSGPDGALWFLTNTGTTQSVGRMTTGGIVTEYAPAVVQDGGARRMTSLAGSVWVSDIFTSSVIQVRP